jgi:hypothetical protein
MKLFIEILNMYTHQVTDNPKYLEKPDDNNNHNHNIEDGFDFVIHGNVCIDKP